MTDSYGRPCNYVEYGPRASLKELVLASVCVASWSNEERKSLVQLRLYIIKNTVYINKI